MTEQDILDSHDEDAAPLRGHKRLSCVSRRWCRSQHKSVSSTEAWIWTHYGGGVLA